MFKSSFILLDPIILFTLLVLSNFQGGKLSLKLTLFVNDIYIGLIFYKFLLYINIHTDQYQVWCVTDRGNDNSMIISLDETIVDIIFVEFVTTNSNGDMVAPITKIHKKQNSILVVQKGVVS